MRLPSLEQIVGTVVLAAAIYGIVAPLASATYPPMTDLPFHAAQSSNLRHYFDPSFHVHEQFEFHPLASPYLALYVIAAGLMLVFPMLAAMKIAAALLLALLPIGLATMFHGLKKSPWLGLLSLGLCWGQLTHWGFLNFVGSIGLFALAIGLTLLLLDSPSRKRQLALSGALLALFFTHIFHVPFALLAVLGTVLALYPATRRWRPIVLPLFPVLVLFILWLWLRPPELNPPIGPLSLHGERLTEFFAAIYGGFNDPVERTAFIRYAWIISLVAGVCTAMAALDTYKRRRISAWEVGATVVSLASALLFFLLFLGMPMHLGIWWYVYPREATATAFMLLSLCPDLPRANWLRVPLLLAMAAGGLGIAQVVVRNYAGTNAATADFTAIIQTLPRAPKLLYLILNHRGTTRTQSPFTHLPAYVQAEKGGWLSSHFASSNASPLTYRRPGSEGAVLPPAMPAGWERKPREFPLPTTASFFDWFLVRGGSSPSALFAADPSIELANHVGSWWLYKRNRSPTGN